MMISTKPVVNFGNSKKHNIIKFGKVSIFHINALNFIIKNCVETSTFLLWTRMGFIFIILNKQASLDNGSIHLQHNYIQSRFKVIFIICANQHGIISWNKHSDEEL